MKPAKSSASKCCRSATTRLSPPRSRGTARQRRAIVRHEPRRRILADVTNRGAGMTPLWTVEAMAAAMGAERAGPLPSCVPGISIDSRTLKVGEAFFAITGDQRDGHEFVTAALERGAGLAVVTADRRDSFADDAALLVVTDVLAALRE